MHKLTPPFFILQHAINFERSFYFCILTSTVFQIISNRSKTKIFSFNSTLFNQMSGEEKKKYFSSVHASGKQQTEARHLLKHTFARCDEREKDWINFNELGFCASSEKIAQWMSLSESINKIFLLFVRRVSTRVSWHFIS